MEDLSPFLKIARIIAKEKLNGLTDEESKALQDWLAENDKNKQLYSELRNNNNLINEFKELESYHTKEAWNKVKILINSDKRPKVLPFIPNMFKYAAAVIIFVTGIYFVYNYLNNAKIEQLTENTIGPGTQQAVLTTADNTR